MPVGFVSSGSFDLIIKYAADVPITLDPRCSADFVVGKFGGVYVSEEEVCVFQARSLIDVCNNALDGLQLVADVDVLVPRIVDLPKVCVCVCACLVSRRVVLHKKCSYFRNHSSLFSNRKHFLRLCSNCKCAAPFVAFLSSFLSIPAKLHVILAIS